MALTIGAYVRICEEKNLCPLRTYERANVRDFLNETRDNPNQENLFRERVKELSTPQNKRP
jgi:hypothetical protein